MGDPRMKLLLLFALSFAAACSQPGAVQDTPRTPVAEDADCNLSTVLVPGIPGSPGNLIKSSRNPNGDSELAALMRAFVDDLRDARVLVEAGQPVKKLYPTHRTMRCAWPTKLSERNQDYDTRAQGYLAAVRAFDAEPRKSTYNAIIAGCIHCHANACGGPLDFIDGMKWE
jgi:hypothetical protein